MADPDDTQVPVPFDPKREHLLILRVKLITEDEEGSFDEANRIAVEIGAEIMQLDAVIEVEGSVDPDVTEDRVTLEF